MWSLFPCVVFRTLTLINQCNAELVVYDRFKLDEYGIQSVCKIHNLKLFFHRNGIGIHWARLAFTYYSPKRINLNPKLSNFQPKYVAHSPPFP